MAYYTFPPPLYSSFSPPFYSTSTTIPVPLSNPSFSHGYTPPSANSYTSSNPYGYGNAGSSGYYNTYKQQPTQPYSQHEGASQNSEIAISVFDGSEDAYWWVLCTEKYFKANCTPETMKVTEAMTALRDRALRWWLWWSHHHPEASWNTFTTALLWRFKPEWRHILPIIDEEEEPASDSLNSAEAPSFNGDSVEPFVEAETFVVQETLPQQSVLLAQNDTKAFTSPAKGRSIGITAGDKQSTVPPLKTPPLQPPAFDAFVGKNVEKKGSATATKISLTRILFVTPPSATTVRVSAPSPVPPPLPKPPDPKPPYLKPALSFTNETNPPPLDLLWPYHGPSAPSISHSFPHVALRPSDLHCLCEIKSKPFTNYKICVKQLESTNNLQPSDSLYPAENKSGPLQESTICVLPVPANPRPTRVPFSTPNVFFRITAQTVLFRKSNSTHFPFFDSTAIPIDPPLPIDYLTLHSPIHASTTCAHAVNSHAAISMFSKAIGPAEWNVSDFALHVFSPTFYLRVLPNEDPADAHAIRMHLPHGQILQSKFVLVQTAYDRGRGKDVQAVEIETKAMVQWTIESIGSDHSKIGFLVADYPSPVPPITVSHGFANSLAIFSLLPQTCAHYLFLNDSNFEPCGKDPVAIAKQILRVILVHLFYCLEKKFTISCACYNPIEEVWKLLFVWQKLVGASYSVPKDKVTDDHNFVISATCKLKMGSSITELLSPKQMVVAGFKAHSKMLSDWNMLIVWSILMVWKMLAGKWDNVSLSILALGKALAAGILSARAMLADTYVMFCVKLRHHGNNPIGLVGYCAELERDGIAPNGSFLVYIMGIAYLHEELKASLIHCDLKLSNSLLEGLEPTVSDIGLVKSEPTGDQSQGSSQTTEIQGYSSNNLTKFNYAYSLGVILLQHTIFSVRFGIEHQWDPAGYLDLSKAAKWSTFKQWDPGKFIQGSNFYNLEDKVQDCKK